MNIKNTIQIVHIVVYIPVHILFKYSVVMFLCHMTSLRSLCWMIFQILNHAGYHRGQGQLSGDVATHHCLAGIIAT